MTNLREQHVGPCSKKDHGAEKDGDGVEIGTPKTSAPLISEAQRRRLRYYNSKTGKCDLSEEGVKLREIREKAESEESERERRERKQRLDAGIGLTPGARQGLGGFPVTAAWLLINCRIGDALELQPDESQRIADELRVLGQPDDPFDLRTLSDVEELLQLMDPIRGVNYFHDANPEVRLDARIQHMEALKVLEGALRIFVSQRWLENL